MEAQKHFQTFKKRKKGSVISPLPPIVEEIEEKKTETRIIKEEVKEAERDIESASNYSSHSSWLVSDSDSSSSKCTKNKIVPLSKTVSEASGHERVAIAPLQAEAKSLTIPSSYSTTSLDAFWRGQRSLAEELEALENGTSTSKGSVSKLSDFRQAKPAPSVLSVSSVDTYSSFQFSRSSHSQNGGYEKR